MRNGLLVGLSFLMAFILMLLPMPEWAVWVRPAWVLLVLIYWNLLIPYEIGIGAAWLLGILVDFFTGTLLGEHALAMVIVSYFVIKMHARIKMFSLMQQGLCVMLLVLLYQFIIYCVQGFINELPKTKLYWLSSIVSMLLWPWIVSILKKSNRRLKMV